jgi:hypothetical protein
MIMPIPSFIFLLLVYLDVCSPLYVVCPSPCTDDMDFVVCYLPLLINCCLTQSVIFSVVNARICPSRPSCGMDMDRNTSGYSRTVDTDVYEYCNDDFIPIDTLGQANQGALFRPASSDQLSLQGTSSSSQQSSLLQNFYRTSSQHSSLTSSSQGVGVVRYSSVRVNILTGFGGIGTWTSASTVSPECLTAFALSLGKCRFA